MSLQPQRRAPQAIDTPEVIPWQTWYEEQYYTWAQGEHRLFVGPTQSGKTTLCRYLVRYRDYVVVLGTKPRDPSLDAYIKEGYKRIYQWPPREKDMKPDADGCLRLILWPKIVKIADLKDPKIIEMFRRCINDVFVGGGWTIVIDEGLWVGSREGLGLGDEISAISYASASSKVTMCLIVQRPAGVPRISWSSVSDAMIFHGGVTDDVRELASLGTHSPNEVKQVIQTGLAGRQFLDLPCRGGKEWSISEVEL